MNINSLITTDYENKWQRRVRKNKPNSNPNKPNFRRAKMNINSITTKDYRKNDDFTLRINKPNSNPISVTPKMSANVFITKDYENKTTLSPPKNKPNQTQFQMPTNPSKERGKKVRKFFWLSVAGKDIILFMGNLILA